MKKLLYIPLCMIVLLSLTGCFSRKEPKTLAIVKSAIYDLTEDGKYSVTLEILNPSASGGVMGGGGGDKNPNMTATGEGISVAEALRDVSHQLEKSIFGGHNRVRIFTERFAQKDMASVMDFFARDHLTDETSLVVILKGEEDPMKIHSCKIGLSDMVGDFIDSLSNSQPGVISKSVFVTTLDFIKDYYSDGKQPVAGVIELVECEDKPAKNTDEKSQQSQDSQDGGDGSNPFQGFRIEYRGLAAFKDNKLVGYMDGTEARAYNFVANNLQTDYVSIPSGDDFTVARIHGSKSDSKVSFEDGRVSIEVNVNVTLDIIQEGGTLDVSKIEPLKQAEEGFNKQIEQEITAAISKAQQEFQSDIFGFGNSLHASNPEKWKEIQENWDETFSSASVQVTVKSSIDRSGQLKEPFRLEELK